MPIAVGSEDLQDHLQLDDGVGAGLGRQAVPPRLQRPVDRVDSVLTDACQGQVVPAHEVVLAERVLNGRAVATDIDDHRGAEGHQDPGADVEFHGPAQDGASAVVTTRMGVSLQGPVEVTGDAPTPDAVPHRRREVTTPGIESKNTTDGALVPKLLRQKAQRPGIPRHRPAEPVEPHQVDPPNPGQAREDLMNPPHVRAGLGGQPDLELKVVVLFRGRPHVPQPHRPPSCTLSRSGTCSTRRPLRLAGNRRRHGWATSHVTSRLPVQLTHEVVLQPGLQMQMRLRRRAEGVNRQVTRARLCLGGTGPHQPGDIRAVRPRPDRQPIPEVEQPLGL